MQSVKWLCIVLAGMLCFAQAAKIRIMSEFKNGDILFAWTNTTTRSDLIVTKDGQRGKTKLIYDYRYTVEDVWKYKSVKISVWDFEAKIYIDSTYNVALIESTEGESKNISTIIADLPARIYHIHNNTTKAVLQVDRNSGSAINGSPKYIFYNKPTYPNIHFEIKHITPEDGGYYTCSSTQQRARYKDGVILLVRDMSELRTSLNGNPGSTIEVKEDDMVRISCHAEGNPLPEVSVSKAGQPIRGSSGHGWFNHTFRAIQCLDTDTYTCRGTNEIHGSKETNFSINVLCIPRLDMSAKFQYVYWSTSGSDVKLNVVVPVISNPLPDNKMFSWLSPRNTTTIIIDTVVKQKDDVKYKYRIISTISVTNQTCFGSYTLRYNGRDIVTITINDKDLRDPSSKTEYRLQIIVIGVSVALFIIIVVGTVAVMAYVRRKKLKQQQPQQDRISAIITIEDSPQPDQVVVTDDDTSQPDQVQYAAVDRNTLMRNRNQTDKGIDGATKTKNDENDAAYAKTEESTLMTKTENRTNDEKTTPQGDDEKTDTNNRNTEPRTVNQEGLIYIDVAFANKPESSNTNKKSVVHGEEDKTEYTFVDFSKKAPPIQEKPGDNNSD